MDIIGGGPCPKCNRFGEKVRDIEEHERLPATEVCDTCKTEMSEHAAIVAAGGVYWRCEDCPASGVIKADAPFAAAVRERLGVPAPEPCGATFSKADCPACRD